MFVFSVIGAVQIRDDDDDDDASSEAFALRHFCHSV